MSGKLLDVVRSLTSLLEDEQKEAAANRATIVMLEKTINTLHQQMDRDKEHTTQSREALASEIARFTKGRRISGIKILRMATGMGLREAKELYEAVEPTVEDAHNRPERDTILRQTVSYWVNYMAEDLRAKDDGEESFPYGTMVRVKASLEEALRSNI